MSETNVSMENHHEPELYEICLKGQLHARWANRFEGMSFTYGNDGTTILFGPVADQAALHGLLRKVRDLSLPLVSVIQIDPKLGERPECKRRHISQNRSKKETNT